MSLIALFLASLLGSWHCAAMCGGFVACCSGSAKAKFAPTITYNLGRLFTYILLGAAAGVLGQSVDLAGNTLGIGRLAAIIVGVLLIAWGVLGYQPSSTASAGPTILGRLQAFLFNGVFKRLPQSWVWRSLLIGLMTGLLPCGFLYGFVFLAAATGNLLDGSLVMLVFWLGTVPALSAVSFMARYCVPKLGRLAPKLASALLIIAGVFSLTGHFGGLSFLHDHSAHQPSTNHTKHSEHVEHHSAHGH